MKVTMPNPNFPAEIDEIETAMRQYMACQENGRIDLYAFSKWDETKPDAIFEAVHRLRGLLETIYPPTVIDAQTVTEEAEEVKVA